MKIISAFFLLAFAVPTVRGQAPATDENEYFSLINENDSECVIDGPCIKSHAAAGVDEYMNNERCTFVAKQAGTLRPTFFETESGYDFLTVGNVAFSGNGDDDDDDDDDFDDDQTVHGGRLVSVVVTPNTDGVWDTDGSAVELGFEVCYGLPPAAENRFWILDETPQGGSECVIDGNCVKSHAGAGVTEYENHETCQFTTKQSGRLYARFFDTEEDYDFVTVDGTPFDGTIDGTGTDGNPFLFQRVQTGSTVHWNTDGSVTELGFEICFDFSGSGRGDPHFKLWSGEWYDFHGICDQVLTSSPSFGNGLGLDIHIRTKPRYEYSFIEAAAIKIGDDVLEVGSWGQCWFNGVENAGLPVTMAGKYPVKLVGADKKHHKFVITLDELKNEQIVVNVFKDLVNVNVEHASMGSFGASSGLLGSFPEGLMLARDGATAMESHDLFGQEWQVMPNDPQLFQSRNENQHFEGICVPPTATAARRLGEGIDTEAAERACAHHKDEKMKDMCIFDVMAMADLEVAEINGAF